MSHKTLFIFLSLFFIYQIGFSQKPSTTYLDEAFLETEKALATYYRMAIPHPDGTKKYLAQTYYISGKLKSSSNYLDKSCLQEDGHFTSYFENNIKESEGDYISGGKTGIWNTWFDNGQLKSEGTYDKGTKKGTWKNWFKNGQQKEIGDYSGDWQSNPLTRYKINSLWNMSGQQLVINGNGEAVHYYEDTITISSQGEYKDGLKKGSWKGFTKDNKPAYDEFYKKQGVTGTSWDENNIAYQYDKYQELTASKGGMAAFYKYVGRSLRYPDQARMLGIQGRVFLQFVVDKSGELTKVKVVKGIGGGCDEEAVRVVIKAQKWSPGKERGQPKKTRMILPFTFKLS
jgi:TonB family protein